MSGFSIDINNKIDFGKITDEVKQVIDDELNAFGLLTVADAKTLCPVDEGFLRNSITFDKEPLAVTIIVGANYAAYLEFGTRGFAAAYVASLPADWQAFAATFRGGSGSIDDFFVRIFEWVKRKGIEESAAYAIAKKILRFGIRPRPYLFPAIQKNTIELIDNLKRQLNA